MLILLCKRAIGSTLRSTPSARFPIRSFKVKGVFQMATAQATTRPVLIAGTWRDADASGSFQATDPNTATPREAMFPVSTWADCDAALDAAVAAHAALR